MDISYNQSLKNLNTFKVDISASQLITIHSVQDLSSENFQQLLNERYVIVGQASNILFTKDFNGSVILMQNKGIDIIKEDKTHIYVKAQSGEKWEDLVEWSIKNNLVGLQNLADIPGTVGATPIQNVGAYGVEIKDVLESVEVFNIKDKNIQEIMNNDCLFKYRDSIFKHELKDKVIILSVTFKLEKFTNHISERYFTYKDINERIKDKQTCTLKELFNTIQQIRKEKLPPIHKYGSCGSTFKNPEITVEEYCRLKGTFPELPSFETDAKGIVKIPAAHILEKLGWKNKRIGDVGTWIYHPLIVTNYGKASPKDILSFIENIQADFSKNTDIPLEAEINII